MERQEKVALGWEKQKHKDCSILLDLFFKSVLRNRIKRGVGGRLKRKGVNGYKHS